MSKIKPALSARSKFNFPTTWNLKGSKHAKIPGRHIKVDKPRLHSAINVFGDNIIDKVNATTVRRSSSVQCIKEKATEGKGATNLIKSKWNIVIYKKGRPNCIRSTNK